MSPDPIPDPNPIEPPAPRRAPHLDEINWKKRALDAEAALEAARAELEAVSERCATHERNIESIAKAQAESEAEAARERGIADALAPHHPIDAALCAILVERELEQEPPDGEPAMGDISVRIAGAVARLTTERPYLFRANARSVSHAGATMARLSGTPARDPIDDALEEARSSGSRSQLLRYLRLRRGA
ncbi:MAG: hypothetical protein KF902_14270 [Phycisphaeraceae bacterium]|nr:hypothetical protein [Phycisphaeraceae bacterium]